MAKWPNGQITKLRSNPNQRRPNAQCQTSADLVIWSLGHLVVLNKYITQRTTANSHCIGTVTKSFSNLHRYRGAAASLLSRGTAEGRSYGLRARAPLDGDNSAYEIQYTPSAMLSNAVTNWRL